MFIVTPTMLYLATAVFVLVVMVLLAHYHIELAARLKKLNALEDTQVTYFMGAYALVGVLVPAVVFIACICALMYFMQSVG